MLRYILKILLALSTFLSAIIPAKPVEVYLFRGAGDFSFVADRLTFSQGMDDLRDEIRDVGIHADVYRWQNAVGALADIRRRKPTSVALIGHSMGALAAITTAAELNREGIKVSYLGLIDIPGPVGSVPNGVMWAENFYSLFPVYGLLPIPASSKSIITNNYVFGQIHTTMDNSRKIHNAMMSAIWQIDDIDRGIREPVTLRAFAAASTPQTATALGSVEAVATPGSLQPVQ
jgi:pimeloyl-ACP methyl ester carboxylesterase